MRYLLAWYGWFCNLRVPVTLTRTLDPGQGHTVVHLSSSITCIPKFHRNQRNFLWTDGNLPPTVLSRLPKFGSRPNKWTDERCGWTAQKHDTFADTVGWQWHDDVPMLSVWQAICGRRKQVRTFSPVSSSMSVWNLSSGWAWFSDSQIAFRLQAPRLSGRWRSLHRQFNHCASNLFLPHSTYVKILPPFPRVSDSKDAL